MSNHQAKTGGGFAPNGTTEFGVSSPYDESSSDTDTLDQAMQGAALQPVPAGGTMAGYSLDRGSGLGLIDWIIDSAGAQTHRRVMNHNRDVAVETMDAMSLTSMLAADFVANSLETERAMEQTILQNRDSKMALASAPVYVQLARQMQMQTMPAIAQTGMNRIKHKIEHR